MSLTRVVLVAAIASAVGGARADEPKAPKPLPKEVTDAWKKAGAEAGWYDRQKSGADHFAVRDEGRAGELPALRFRKWTAGTIPPLPAPGVPFMLDLGIVGADVDGGMKDLAGLKDLRALSLIGTKVTEKGLKELAGIKELQVLDLALALGVRDTALKELAVHEQLQKLTLGSTFVSDKGMADLGKLTDLRFLDLGVTTVSDEGLKDLAGLKELRTLNLFATRVTDSGLKRLVGMNKLQSLDLSRTAVTDAGLKDLADLKELRVLSLDGTKVTKAGIAGLQKDLPMCKITR